METYLVLVGGVEWNLTRLLIAVSVITHVTDGQLDALE